MRDLYLFPANNRANAATLHDQLRKTEDEAIEALNAQQNNEGNMRVIEELLDTIHAAEGALRKFPEWQVHVCVALVKIKNFGRGDYL